VTIAGWAATAAIHWREMRAAQEQAEQEKQKADQAREEERQVRDRMERALYASRILLAQKEFAEKP
jgi:hypothetical protein